MRSTIARAARVPLPCSARAFFDSVKTEKRGKALFEKAGPRKKPQTEMKSALVVGHDLLNGAHGLRRRVDEFEPDGVFSPCQRGRLKSYSPTHGPHDTSLQRHDRVVPLESRRELSVGWRRDRQLH